MEKENNILLKKILNCFYVVIVLLIAIFIAIIVVNGDGSSNKNNSNNTDTDYDVSMFTKVDFESLAEYFDKSGSYVVYVGSATCTYCRQFLPTLQQIQKDYDFKTLYLPLDEVSTASNGYDNLIKKLDLKYTKDGETGEFGDFFGYTPTMIVIKDGKQVAGEIGAMSYDALAEMLEANGFSK